MKAGAPFDGMTTKEGCGIHSTPIMLLAAVFRGGGGAFETANGDTAMAARFL